MKLIKLFRTKKSSRQHALKITGVKGSPTTHDTKIYYQVCGKSVVSADTPRKLVAALGKVEGFSDTDTQLILDLLITEFKSPHYRLVETAYHKNNITIRLKDIRNNHLLTLTPQQIIGSNEIKKGLSVDTLEQVMYFFYKQQILREKQILSKSHNIRKIKFHVYSNH